MYKSTQKGTGCVLAIKEINDEGDFEELKKEIEILKKVRSSLFTLCFSLSLPLFVLSELIVASVDNAKPTNSAGIRTWCHTMARPPLGKTNFGCVHALMTARARAHTHHLTRTHSHTAHTAHA